MRLLLLFAVAFPMYSQQYEMPRTISVSGEALVMVAPDQAVVTMGVETYEGSLSVAEATNERVARALLATWKSEGISDANIRSNAVAVSISYDNDSRPPRNILGYVVTRSYEVTASNAAQAERVITRGIAAGANQVSQVEFRNTQMRRYRDQARASAVKAAREKVDLLTTSLGVAVGLPRTVTETTSYYGRYGQTAMTQNVMNYQGDASDSETSGAVAPGMIGIRASVAVTFDLITK